MSTTKTGNRYDEDFNRTLVNLYQSGGKSQAALCKEYGVSATALGRWIKQYSTVETDDGGVLTAKQVKELQKRNYPEGLMFHSDRGSQYTAFSFLQLLDSLNIVQSFSKKGYPFDNACCECFFKYLKKEETNRKTYHSLQELQLSVFEYIEGFYNSKRSHGSLGMLTPNEKEELFWNQV